MNTKETGRFFKNLEKQGVIIPKEYQEKIAEKINKTLNYVPSVGVFGKTGAGKSSLCNALFGAETCEVSDIAACTRDPQDVLLNMGENGMRLVDVPGVGESQERDEEYADFYNSLMPELDLILWVLKGDDRAFSSDEAFYKNIVKPHLKNGTPFFIVLNQVDKIEPFREWDEEARQPGPKQSKSIEEKRRSVSGYFELPLSQIIAVSANEKFGLIELVDRIIDALPGEKRVSVLRNVEKAYRSVTATKSAEKGFFTSIWDGIKSAVSETITQNGPAIVKSVVTAGIAVAFSIFKGLRPK